MLTMWPPDVATYALFALVSDDLDDITNGLDDLVAMQGL